MAATDLAIRIATILDASGINKAGKSVDGFDKKLKTLGRTLGVTLSGAAVAAFGKKAAQAFITDQKEAARLTQVVKNLGLELSSPAINEYIDTLSKASGVTDSQLRPAFQALLTTTGSLTASQAALRQAIDVSVGSGVALETVAQDLASAYVGQTRGLRKYNLGLSQAQLKTASFEEVTARLNKQFSGANAAYLDTYAGKLQVLSTAAGEAQEKIGAAIIDLTLALAGTGSVDELVTKIDRMADRFVGLMDRFTEGVAIIKAMLGAKTWTGMFKAAQEAQVAEFNRRLKRDYMKVWEGTNIPKTAAQTAAERAAEAAARKRAEQIRKEQEKQTRELKKQATLKKAGTVFDMEQIQIIAALKGKLSEEDKIRLQAQLAILNENDALAASLTKQILMAQDSTGGLYKFFLAIGDMKIKNPFAFLDEWIMEFQKKLNALKFPNFQDPTGSSGGNKNKPSDPATNPFNFPIGPKGGIGGTTISPNVSSNLAIQDTFNAVMIDALTTGMYALEADKEFTQAAVLALSSARYEAAAQAYGMGGNTGGTIQLELTTDGSKLMDAIAEGLQQKSLSTGDSSYINRRTGGFAG